MVSPAHSERSGMSDQGTAMGEGHPGAGVSIRDCVATPSRIVLFLEGQLVPDALQRYEVENMNGLGSPITVDSLAEVDVGARTVVFPNRLVVPARPGDWLRVDLLAPDSARVQARYFARVRSDLALSDVKRSDDRTNSSTTSSRRSGALMRDPALLVVITGLAVLVVLGVVAMLSASSNDMGTIASAAFGVIGSVVGAFFGVRAGLGDRERVHRELRIEATKGQMLAAMMPEENKPAALEMLKEYGPEPAPSDKA
jgi:uncharacterized membrane protein YeaQ/YmgE (transglycosylase-associated protein family)